MKKVIILSSALCLLASYANAQVSVTFGDVESYPPNIYSPYYAEYINRYPTGHRHDNWEYWAQERRDQDERERREREEHYRHDWHDNGNHKGNCNNDHDNHERR